MTSIDIIIYCYYISYRLFKKYFKCSNVTIWCRENETFDHHVTVILFVCSILEARISNQMLIFERVLCGPKTLARERCHMDLIWFYSLAVLPPVGLNENPDMANLSGIQ